MTFFLLSPKNYHVLFFIEYPREKNLSDSWINSLFFLFAGTIVIHIMHNWVLYMILILPRHCHIWFWFFPVMHWFKYDFDSSPALSYMILILPRHCLIYDPDSSPSLSYNMILVRPHHCHIWSWFFPVMHGFIYDADSFPSCTVLNMILILPRHCLIYDPDSSPSYTVL